MAANTWGVSPTTWGRGLWGKQSDTLVAVTGQSITSAVGTPDVNIVKPVGQQITSALGSVTAFTDITVKPTTQTITSSVGSTTAEGVIAQGWGRGTWGNRVWVVHIQFK